VKKALQCICCAFRVSSYQPTFASGPVLWWHTCVWLTFSRRFVALWAPCAVARVVTECYRSLHCVKWKSSRHSNGVHVSSTMYHVSRQSQAGHSELSLGVGIAPADVQADIELWACNMQYFLLSLFCLFLLSGGCCCLLSFSPAHFGSCYSSSLLTACSHVSECPQQSRAALSGSFN
jgi:hypothetical protein